ncbi:hypothetical protein COEREDRAFT_82761 [Coemansia reversa NRRL 1564]|uniref:Uncharacterized protein n=1 Tax=Coemansia reversa (strain ATCC 12441 / NRRL 1564) TaxID=763665 RepID=A0A2G5B668_COERN|nr:hypothetical protein COEREDRAFT_82761 [Coemansia reversa NRRL 1564]|eukprot:PIA14499.1 hypothetical protein COEREDRAFT_82761 [Coemansia reversa NRRL 1564]
MDDHSALVDVLLLPDCNLYERYPELVQRVDYFLYEWCEEMLARTASLLRHQEQRMQKGMQQLVGEQSVSSSNDVTFAHKRSTNIVWRQWAVSRLQLPRYPPEQINWNKDADPAFLYGQVPELRLEVPWSARRIAGSGTTNGQQHQQQQQQPRLRLKSALKRTDLQTFLTSPTLSPASSPLHSPMYSPAVSIRENMSTSSFGSEDTLEDDSELKPRLRFNDRVEQCMVVFDQEKECLPTDDEDDSTDDEVQPRRMRQGFDAKRALVHKRRRTRTRRSLVIKLAPTQLKGDHRRLVAVAADAGSRYGYAAYCDSDDDDPLGGCDDAFAMLGERAASGSGVGSYVQGYVQTVAGQVRRFVSDAVMVSSFAKEKPAKPPLQQKSVHDSIVADPYANHHVLRSSGGARRSEDDDYMATYPGHEANTRGVRNAPTAAQVVRDPFSSADIPRSASCDRLPFDDEDAIIQEFEREMHKCSTTASSVVPQSTLARTPPPVPEPVLAETEWSVSDADNLYDTKYHLFMDDDDDCEFASEFGHADFSAYRPAAVASRSNFPYAATSTDTKRPATIPPQQQQVRNESIIDRAEDTIVNTVDAVKWCASFISNYTIF